jgi:hypothetical protein
MSSKLSKKCRLTHRFHAWTGIVFFGVPLRANLEWTVSDLVNIIAGIVCIMNAVSLGMGFRYGFNNQKFTIGNEFTK